MTENDRYHRPVTRRYDPSDAAKRAMCTPWIDADRVARTVIEDNFVSTFIHGFHVDYHGYPTA